VGWYSGRKFLPGGMIAFIDGTQVDLRRSFNRRWKLEATRNEQFLDMRTGGIPSAQTVVVTVSARTGRRASPGPNLMRCVDARADDGIHRHLFRAIASPRCRHAGARRRAGPRAFLGVRAAESRFDREVAVSASC
jgi:hypothetical protein